MRALLVFAALAAPVPALAAGKLVSATGPVTAGGKPVNPGDRLPDGEIVLEKGTATIALGRSRFLLTGPARLTPKPTVFELARGGLLSVTRGLKRRFSVRTTAAVAAVRGTDFYVEARSETETYACICDGKLAVGHPAGGEVEMASSHHSARLFTTEKDGHKTAAAGMEGHTDEQLAVLRASAK